jgi:hypothetical protein
LKITPFDSRSPFTDGLEGASRRLVEPTETRNDGVAATGDAITFKARAFDIGISALAVDAG